MKAETKTNNRLWQIRHQAGLEQKQIAYLLGHKSTDQVSRYERGARLPSFRTALKFELILRTPVSQIFPEQYQQCRAEIAERFRHLGQSRASNQTHDDILTDSHLCTFLNLLLKKKLSGAEVNTARRHAIKLTRRLGDVLSEQSRLD
jgi:transcriptional regulator with XRE-family HTH domain